MKSDPSKQDMIILDYLATVYAEPFDCRQSGAQNKFQPSEVEKVEPSRCPSTSLGTNGLSKIVGRYCHEPPRLRAPGYAAHIYRPSP
ncbi:hypothetical protein HNQ99_002346 [Rhizorhapis suberifaciens]|uniref:Uncharacterized protein n=1 Tax=Rhizorhapis suberifaciens TaxID=13656 RepID=A0A840HWY0_9SPHN|nr:hypothetical protein [Rhizorhapis suberifaciens]